MFKFLSYRRDGRKLIFLCVVLLSTVMLLKKWDVFTWNQNVHTERHIEFDRQLKVQIQRQSESFSGVNSRPSRSRYLRVKSAKVIRRVPLIYAVTPTYARAEQKAELTRLSYTLRLVESLHWIVVEDAANKSSLVTRLLRNCNIAHTHLYLQTPPTKVPDRRLNGNPQRNKALKWLYRNAELPSVVYFVDDDNTYDIQIFEEMRYTTKVSVWPVAFAGGVKFESPAVKDGKVVGWVVGLTPLKKFRIDMAGFAVNTAYLLEAGKPTFSKKPRQRLLESNFLGKLNIKLDDLEPKADNCSKVLVWHTQTRTPSFRNTEEQKPYLQKYSVPDMEV